MIKGRIIRICLWIVLAGVFGPAAIDARAAVVVIANRTRSAVRFEAREQAFPSNATETKRVRPSRAMQIELPSAGGGKQYTLEAGDVISLPLDSRSLLAFKAAGVRAFDLSPYGVYYLGNTRDGKIERP